ncbi:MAG: toll/interleukin-1 receptor domain-containing protein [Planctomycetota bacterium]
MADPEHLTYAQQGSDAWNTWRRANPGIKPDLTGATLCDHQWGNARMAYVDLSLSTLTKTNLRGGDFWRTDLNHSDLSHSDLSRSYFGRAQLHSANLSGADLSTARFVGSDLSGANLTHTKIFHSHFYDTDLSGTDFSHAWVKETTFANVDLSKAKGLDSVKFIGPSSLGVDSIYRSHGLISTMFLRGCGVPEEFINTIPTLSFSSELAFSCFLCHSGMDRVFCEKLFGDLQANGVRCWLLPDDFAKGRGAQFKAHNPDLIYDKLLVICSKYALASDPVIREIERALESQDRGERTRLLSITRDDFLAEKWTHPNKERVVETLCSDFRHWEKPESYERALGKLLAALKSF